MTIVFYYALICAWVANTFLEQGRQPWVFPLLMLVHVVIGTRIAWAGRHDHLRAPGVPALLGASLFLALPPTAPLAMCLLAGGTTRRAALRRNHADALALDLAAAARFWWYTGFLAVVLGVLWAFGFVGLDVRPPPGESLHPYSDPLLLHRDRLRPAGRLVILVISTWYAFLLFRTWQMLSRHRRGPGARPGRGEATAADTVY